jgi:hypothetical protein
MRNTRFTFAVCISVAGLALGCEDGPVTPKPPEPVPDPGALVAVSMAGKVGVLLEEIPESMRDRVAEEILKPESFWLTRAQDQPRLTNFRLNFRHLYYPDTGKGQLPIPPEPALRFKFAEAGPQRVKVDGLDMIVVDYTLESYLVTTVASVEESEPALATVDGTWEETITLPVDPTLLMERTGYACLSEADFPPNSVTSENAYLFFDDTCIVELPTAPLCHWTQPGPEETCIEALTRATGHFDAVFSYKRVAWDQAVADEYRIGAATTPDFPDMSVRADFLENNHIVYRYFPPDDCAIEEKCVGGPGWRRLLMFDAMDENLGGAPLTIGPVDYYLVDGDLQNHLHGMYEFSSCHGHYHFAHYGDFMLEGVNADAFKAGFCVLNTDRLANHELSPLTSPFRGCDNQGTQAGWADRYAAGIACQWMDITDSGVVGDPVDATLVFHSNPRDFLCEGKPVMDENGEQMWEPTEFMTSEGKPVDRPVCEFFPGASDNNIGTTGVNIPETGGVMTSACKRNQVGPLRNCDFEEKDNTPTCTPGQQVKLSCAVEDATKPQVVRVCDYSFALGEGTACAAVEARANKVVDGASVEVTFTCPEKRDDVEVGGRYAIYTAPLWNEDGDVPVTCAPTP